MPSVPGPLPSSSSEERYLTEFVSRCLDDNESDSFSADWTFEVATLNSVLSDTTAAIKKRSLNLLVLSNLCTRYVLDGSMFISSMGGALFVGQLRQSRFSLESSLDNQFSLLSTGTSSNLAARNYAFHARSPFLQVWFRGRTNTRCRGIILLHWWTRCRRFTGCRRPWRISIA